METLFGVLLGYVIRGTTGSDGFREVVESARAVTGSQEFHNFVEATKAHAAHVIRDLSGKLSESADQVADVLVAGGPLRGAVEAAEWESWAQARKHDRPFSEDVNWPER